MDISIYFLALHFLIVIGQDNSNLLGLDCCPEIRISSTAFARDHQPASMGNYFSMNGKLNNRLVYKHYTGRLVHLNVYTLKDFNTL